MESQNTFHAHFSLPHLRIFACKTDIRMVSRLYVFSYDKSVVHLKQIHVHKFWIKIKEFGKRYPHHTS